MKVEEEEEDDKLLKGHESFNSCPLTSTETCVRACKSALVPLVAASTGCAQHSRIRRDAQFNAVEDGRMDTEVASAEVIDFLVSNVFRRKEETLQRNSFREFSSSPAPAPSTTPVVVLVQTNVTRAAIVASGSSI